MKDGDLKILKVLLRTLLGLSTPIVAGCVMLFFYLNAQDFQAHAMQGLIVSSLVWGLCFGLCWMLHDIKISSFRSCFKTLIDARVADLVGANHTSRQLVEVLKMLAGPLVAELDAAEVAEPRERPLRHVAPLAKAAAVRVLAWASSGAIRIATTSAMR
jgi:hypothetical protein